MKPILLPLAFSMLAAPSAVAEILHVPSSFPTIQSAIDAADPGDTVLVANGIYQGPGNRDIRFHGKAITVRSQNGPDVTIIDAQGTPTVPHRAFLFSNAETRSSVLDGFTITGGATLPGAIADIFNGGGILIQAASPTIRNCKFIDNQCGCWGAAIYSGDFTETTAGIASPLIENCFFENNAADDEGGGFFSWGNFQGSEPIVRNSVFINNSAGAGGGGVTNFGGNTLTLDHVTMVNNQSPSGFGANAFLGDTVISNSIVWGDSGPGFAEWSTTSNTISFSMIQGGAPGVGNLDVLPNFQPDGFHLRPTSPLIDAGQAAGPSVGGFDIDGQPRLIGRRTDIGADETTRRFLGNQPGPGISRN